MHHGFIVCEIDEDIAIRISTWNEQAPVLAETAETAKNANYWAEEAAEGT